MRQPISRRWTEFWGDARGAVALVVVLMATVLTLLIGTVIDTSRLYMARAQAQAALDAASLGAVATASTVSVGAEAQRLFNANFQASRTRSTVSSVAVTNPNSTTFQFSITVRVPTLIMKYLASNSISFTLTTTITRGFNNVGQAAEIALVLDNTGSMAGSKISDLKTASRDLVNAVFGGASDLTIASFNIVPYNTGVKIGNTAARRAWMQAAWQASFTGIAANRNADNPPGALDDFTDAAPLTEATRFRLPNPAADGLDYVDASVAPLAFGLKNKGNVNSAINAMNASGSTRINVGLMWGWMSLSPNWQGLWDPGKPDLPHATSVLSQKILVLMTDGLNTVYEGNDGDNNDDDTTAHLCEAIKAQGMIIYTVGFGSASSVNQDLLRNCATAPSYYFLAPTAEDLQQAFASIGDRIVYNTIRVSN